MSRRSDSVRPLPRDPDRRSWILVAWSILFGIQYLVMIVERKLPGISSIAKSLRHGLRTTLGY